MGTQSQAQAPLAAAGATAGKEDTAEDGKGGVEQRRDAGEDEGLPVIGASVRQQDERSEQDAEAGDAGKAGNDAAGIGGLMSHDGLPERGETSMARRGRRCVKRR